MALLYRRREDIVMTNLRLGICGGMAAGKTLAADTISEYVKYGKDSDDFFIFPQGIVERLSFADGVRDVAWDFFPEEMMIAFELGVKHRELLQKIGKGMRAIDTDIWVKKLERILASLIGYGIDTPIIIDDVRYPNEVEMLKKFGFKIVYIDVGPEIRRERAGNPDWWDEAVKHESETQVLDWDETISGKCDKDTFKERVLCLLKK